MPIATLFFDIGGVLLSNAWDHHERRQAWAKFGLDAAQIAECEGRHEAPAFALERGEITLSDYLRQVVFFRPRPFSEAAFLDCMRALSVPMPESLALLKDVSAAGRVELATLNNEGRELNEYRIEHFGLRQYFRVFCTSCYLGIRKPDPGIFRRAMGIVQRRPGECLFIDDRPENIAGAKSAGMDAVQFVSAKNLRADLVERGLL